MNAPPSESAKNLNALIEVFLENTSPQTYIHPEDVETLKSLILSAWSSGANKVGFICQQIMDKKMDAVMATEILTFEVPFHMPEETLPEEDKK